MKTPIEWNWWLVVQAGCDREWLRQMACSLALISKKFEQANVSRSSTNFSKTACKPHAEHPQQERESWLSLCLEVFKNSSDQA